MMCDDVCVGIRGINSVSMVMRSFKNVKHTLRTCSKFYPFLHGVLRSSPMCSIPPHPSWLQHGKDSCSNNRSISFKQSSTSYFESKWERRRTKFNLRKFGYFPSSFSNFPLWKQICTTFKPEIIPKLWFSADLRGKVRSQSSDLGITFIN